MSKPETSAGIVGASIVGTWRLLSHWQETVETGEKVEPRGPHPEGLLIYTSDGHFSIIAVPEKRPMPVKVLVTDEEALGLFRGLTAYSGRYSLKDAGTLIHHIDVSWNAIWGKTDQERRFRLEGDRLTLIAGPDLNPRDGKLAISTLVWERER